MFRNLIANHRPLFKKSRNVLLTLGIGNLFVAPVYASNTTPASESHQQSRLDIKLYGYKTCPFCNKVGTFLDFLDVPYSLVQVNPIFKDELSFSPDYKKVPIVLLNDERIINSDSIIDVVNQKVAASRNVEPLPSNSDIQEWRNWVNSHLVHVLVSNVYRTPGECVQTMNYLSEVEAFSSRNAWIAKYGGAVAMYLIAWKIRYQHGLSMLDPRSDLEAAMTKWFDGLHGNAFHGGDRPDLADLAVFGALRSMENLDTFSELMKMPSRKWYMQMADVCGDPKHIRF